MKIIHFTSGNITGGAARGAYFLHQALKDKEIDSHFFIPDKAPLEGFEDVNYLSNELQKTLDKYRNRSFEQYILNQYPNRRKEIFSLGRGVYDNEIVALSKEADIVHFHWVNDHLLNLELFERIDKPIVWTFRDMWPFTGGCHYSMGCEKYKSGCNLCDLLQSNSTEDISKWVFSRKESSFRNIYPVAISTWLKDCAASSKLFQHKEVHMIANCIDTNTFIPFNKKQVRKELGLPLDKVILLFGAINAYGDKRKGFPLLLEALTLLENKDEFHLVTFGGSNSSILNNTGFSYTSFGTINDDNQLAKIYSASSVFIAPSIEEAFGKTIVEAMSCATPVVAFNATGPKDLIKHEKTGYLAKPFDTADLVRGIAVITKHQSYEKLCRASRLNVVDNFSLEIIAQQYINFYKKIIQDFSLNKNKKVSINSQQAYRLERHMIDFKESIEFEWLNNNKWHVFNNKKDHLLDKINNRKVAIYGTGSFGKKMKKYLSYYGVKVDAFIDSNINLRGTMIDKQTILSLDECKDYFIIIASTWHKDIESVLLKNSFTKNDYVISII